MNISKDQQTDCFLENEGLLKCPTFFQFMLNFDLDDICIIVCKHYLFCQSFNVKTKYSPGALDLVEPVEKKCNSLEEWASSSLRRGIIWQESGFIGLMLALASSSSVIICFYFLFIFCPHLLISSPYQMIVADAADAVSVNFSGRCKFLQI